MALNNFSRILSIHFSRTRIGLNFKGGVRQIHHSPIVPQVPFIGLHDANKFSMVSKNGFFPLEYFKPEIPRMDIVTLRKSYELAVQNITKLRKRFLTSSELDLILISSGAIQAVRVGGLRNYIVSTSEVLFAEMVNMKEKIKKTAVEVGDKVTKISNDSPLGRLMEKWKVLKEKLPGWQNTIAAKLQSMQDSLNKKIN